MVEYTPAVMDHFLNPRNLGEVAGADGTGMAQNPQDGDTVQISLQVAESRVNDVKFKAQGCVAAIAASSMLTELVKLRSLTCLEASKRAIESCKAC